MQFIAREQFTAAVATPAQLGYDLRVAVRLPKAGRVDAWALPQTVLIIGEGERCWMRGVIADADAADASLEPLEDTAFLLAGADVITGADFETVPAADTEIRIAEPVLPTAMGALASRYGGRRVLDRQLEDFADLMGDRRPRSELPWRVPVCENGRDPLTSRSLGEHLRKWAASAGSIGFHDGDS